ncbi:MAG TPA: response regulator [Spirochaetota bacterium]|nr:response regulator [Spirochaetota bacterium]
MTENRLPTILVVDDEEIIRITIQKKLSRMGFNVLSFEKAEDALYYLKNSPGEVDLILTDIKLRKMDGIELLQRVNNLDEPVPVLIISGHGNVEDAIRALRYGASDYIRKPFDINDLTSSVRSILKRKFEKKETEVLGQYKQYEKSVMVIPNSSELINMISFNLTKDLVPAGLFNYTTAENIALSLKEAIANAMFHGNFEIDSSLRDSGGMKQFNEEVAIRRNMEPYRDRTVRITYELTPEYVCYEIEDQGKGFNFKSLPDPRDPENFFKNSGRGLLIIRIHMDEVSWNSTGNITILKKYKVCRNA